MKVRVKRRWKIAFRHIAIVVTSSSLIFVFFRLSQAGSLTPIAAPASTFNTLKEIYDSLASDSFDSSSITASKSGSVLNVSKCIVSRMTGGTCP